MRHEINWLKIVEILKNYTTEKIHLAKKWMTESKLIMLLGS
jgi:hypothetical protein